MSISDKLKAGGSKVLRTAMAGVLAIGLMPAPALAADLQAGSLGTTQSTVTTAANESKSIEGLVIASAYAAANPAPEILGLSNPSQRYASEGETTYTFFGDSATNSNPDPFLYNYKHGGQPTFFIGTHETSPMSALRKYGTLDASDGVWNLAPHIVLGTGSDKIPSNEHAFYDTADYARAAETANGWEANSYHPIGVTYNRTSLPTMIQTMYRLAKAADEAIAKDKTIAARYSGVNDQTADKRYKTVADIAKDYERYILGQKGLVKKAIDSGKESMKTVALVQSYDSSNQAYTIITDGVAEGTATTNRYLEAVQGVAKNYYDTVGAAGSTKVRKDDLARNVELIIIGSNVGNSSNDLIGQLTTDGLLDKTYYCKNWSNGSSFGTTVNSVENAQNVGRILPGLYKNVLDQHDMIAYYYDVFYHIQSGELGTMIDKQMDGVRNWSPNTATAYTDWIANDVKDYDYAKVESKLIEGVAYLNSQTGLSDYLTPTSDLKDDKSADINLSAALVTVGAGVDTAITPEPTVTYGTTTLTKGTDYTVSYSYDDNKGNVGSTGTVTVTAKDGSGYTGTKSATFKVIADNNFKTGNGGVTVTLDKNSYAFSGEAIKPVVTVKGNPSATLNNSTALKEGKDYTVSYSNNQNAAKSNASKNAPTITLKGIGDYAGTITKTFTIDKLTTTISLAGYKKTYTYGDSLSLTGSIDKGYTIDGGSLTYESSDSDVIDVSQGRNGWDFKIVGTGTATIEARAAQTTNCKAASATTAEITVNPRGKQNISNVSPTLEITYSSSATSLDAKIDGGGKLTYESSNKDVATINAKGEIQPLKPGTTNIKVSGAAAKSADGDVTYAEAADPVTCAVTVKKLENQTVQLVAPSTGKMTKAAGTTYQMKATTDGGGDITYSSSNTNVATVSNTGLVTVKGAGTADIIVEAAEKLAADKTTVCAGEGSQTCVLTATQGKATITASDKSVVAGKTVSLGATTTGDSALKYTSKNTSIATVNSAGVVTGVKPGKAVITISSDASANFAAASKDVTVTVTAKPVPAITASNKSVLVNGTVNLGATVVGGGKLTYSTSNAKVATVNALGVVTGVAAGTATITINAAETANYAAASKTVTVTVTTKAATIKASNKQVKMGKTVKLGASVDSGAALSYTSSNTKVAKVNAKGVVTPVKAGTAKITIKSAAKGAYAAASKTVTVTVKAGSQSLTFKKQTKSVKKGKTVAITKAKGAKTTVTYSITGNKAAKKAFTINKKTGKLTAKKAVKGKTYKVTVKATAKKTANWTSASKSAVITVKVK